MTTGDTNTLWELEATTLAPPEHLPHFPSPDLGLICIKNGRGVKDITFKLLICKSVNSCVYLFGRTWGGPQELELFWSPASRQDSSYITGCTHHTEIRIQSIFSHVRWLNIWKPNYFFKRMCHFNFYQYFIAFDLNVLDLLQFFPTDPKPTKLNQQQTNQIHLYLYDNMIRKRRHVWISVASFTLSYPWLLQKHAVRYIGWKPFSFKTTTLQQL